MSILKFWDSFTLEMAVFYGISNLLKKHITLRGFSKAFLTPLLSKAKQNIVVCSYGGYSGNHAFRRAFSRG